MKIPDAKEAVDKEWEKLEKMPAWQQTKVRNKNEVISGVVDGHLSSPEFGVGTTVSEIQRPSGTPRSHCKR